jgi:surface antigen
VLAWDNRDASGRFLYNNGIGLLRLLRNSAVVTALLCGLGVAGCSYQLHSLLSKDDADADRTSSAARPGDQVAAAADPAELSDGDLTYARAAAAEALARAGKDSSVPWQNPETGAGGNITPLNASYKEGGLSCRDFLASYVHAGSQDWLQGAGCRTSAGIWEVTRLKPLSQS